MRLVAFRKRLIIGTHKEVHIMNIQAMMQMKKAWDTFKASHPKFPAFMKAAQGTLREGTIIEFKITTPEGKTIESNLKLNASDMELMDTIRQMQH